MVVKAKGIPRDTALCASAPLREIMSGMTKDIARTLAQLDSATADKKLSPSAAANIRAWLTQPRYAEYAPQVAEHIAAGKWKELDDVFWTVIPFGTGGRRGRMYPIGCNAINERTIGESAQGLAEYVREQVQSSRSKVQGQEDMESPPEMTLDFGPQTLDSLA